MIEKTDEKLAKGSSLIWDATIRKKTAIAVGVVWLCAAVVLGTVSYWFAYFSAERYRLNPVIAAGIGIIALFPGATAVLGIRRAQRIDSPDSRRKFQFLRITSVIGFTLFMIILLPSRLYYLYFAMVVDAVDGRGAVVLSYAIDQSSQADNGKSYSEVPSGALKSLENSINRRIAAFEVDSDNKKLGRGRITVRTAKDRIEIVVPRAQEDEIPLLKNHHTTSRVGSLELAILACEHDSRHGRLIDLATKNSSDEREIYEVGEDGKRILTGRWIPVARLPGPQIVFKNVFSDNGSVTRDVQRDGIPVPEFLVEINPNLRITGDHIDQVSPAVSESGPCLGFKLDRQGGYLMEQLTQKYRPVPGLPFKSRLAVILNDEIHTAPSINAVIGANGIIDGQFTLQEILELRDVLNNTSSPLSLNAQPIDKYSVGWTIDWDVWKNYLPVLLALAIMLLSCLWASYYLWNAETYARSAALDLLLAASDGEAAIPRLDVPQ